MAAGAEAAGAASAPLASEAAAAPARAACSSNEVDGEDEGVGRCHGLYELWAVVSHKGRSTGAGHYMAFVKDDEGGEGLSWRSILCIEMSVSRPRRARSGSGCVHDSACVVDRRGGDGRARPLACVRRLGRQHRALRDDRPQVSPAQLLCLPVRAFARAKAVPFARAKSVCLFTARPRPSVPRASLFGCPRVRVRCRPCWPFLPLQ